MSLPIPTAQLDELAEAALAAFAAAAREDDLAQAKARFLGKKGELALVMQRMRELPASDRPAFGQAVNDAKSRLEAALDQRLAELRAAERARRLDNEKLDLSLPGRAIARGAVHPLRRVENDIVDIFREMGFAVAHGPEIESDFHNFGALNFPDDHPARDMQDTFHVDGGRLLRTHTSPVQVRTMLANRPPIRIVAPGAVYRSDDIDATHSPCFHQVEGLLVDRGVTMAHLKGTLQAFARRYFGDHASVRLRPSFFPFTEPSVEVDVSCVFCGGGGCRICKHSGWIEILGAGMVDPAVFVACGIDPDTYTGFAFGMGVERVAMLRYGVDDIRHFYENDVRFLAQLG